MIAFEEVSYRYPNTEETAVRNLSFRVEPGELKVVTGASGCGKTTLMRLANGIAPQILGGEVTGTVRIDDCDVSETPVADLAEKVGTLFQDPEEQFFALNVGDEITFALKSRGMTPDDVNARLERAAETLGISHLLDADIHSLSEGQKQKVGLAGILALGPKVLVLDEPSANLDPEATEQLAQILDELKRAGSAILVVDHRLYWLRDTADEVFVMQAGEIRERGPFSILEDEALRARWGLRRDTVSDPRATLPRVKVEEGLCEEEKAGAVFTAEKLSFGYPRRSAIFADAAFAVPAGITALIGDNGTGKTTLARILTGLLKAEGRFALDGNAVGKEGLMPSAGLVLQNADHQLTMRTVEEEIIAAMLAGRWAKESRSGWSGDLGHFAPTDAEKARLEALLTSLRLAPLRGRHPQSLSGGEKQRVVIACALAKDPRILILDEPTSGLDGANLASIAGILREEADKGRAVFLITHDLELLDACDRALDMTDFQSLIHKDNGL